MKLSIRPPTFYRLTFYGTLEGPATNEWKRWRAPERRVHQRQVLPTQSTIDVPNTGDSSKAPPNRSGSPSEPNVGIGGTPKNGRQPEFEGPDEVNPPIHVDDQTDKPRQSADHGPEAKTSPLAMGRKFGGRLARG